jgi:hypothetical protein
MYSVMIAAYRSLRDGIFDMVVFGSKNQRVVFSVNHDEETEYMWMDSFGHKRGRTDEESTRVLIAAALNFVFGLFPDKKQVLFKDNTSITCQGFFQVQLSDECMIESGQTWFMKCFDTEIDPIASVMLFSIEDAMQELNGKLDSRIAETTYRKFYRNHVGFAWNRHIDRHYTALNAAFESFNTYREFLMHIKTTYGRIALKGWLRRFVSGMLPRSWSDTTRFLIRRCKVPVMELDVSRAEPAQLHRYVLEQPDTRIRVRPRRWLRVRRQPNQHARDGGARADHGPVPASAPGVQ